MSLPFPATRQGVNVIVYCYAPFDEAHKETLSLVLRARNTVFTRLSAGALDFPVRADEDAHGQRIARALEGAAEIERDALV